MSKKQPKHLSASGAEAQEHMSSSSNAKGKKLPEAVAQYIRQQTSQENSNPTSKTANKKHSSSSKDVFLCKICQMIHPNINKYSIGSCRHEFCAGCLGKYISYKIESFQSVQCPNGDCDKTLDEKSGLYLNLPAIQKQKYQKHKRYEMALKNEKIKLCPNQKCDGFLDVKNNSKSTIKNLACISCKKVYCAQCMLPEHEGPCDSYSLEFFQTTLRFRQCPNCKNMVEKAAGCDHITCRCRYQFCYSCGKKYSYGHLCSRPPQPPAPPQYEPCCCPSCHSFCDDVCAPICIGCENAFYCQFFQCFNGGFWRGLSSILYFVFWISLVLPATYLQLIIMIVLRVTLGIFYGLFGFWHVGSDFVKDTGISQWSTPAKATAAILFPLSWLWLIGYTIRKMFQGVDEILTVQYLCYLPFRLLRRCCCD